MISRTEYWEQEYIKAGAYWRHDGVRKRHHALLTKGGHSNGFFNSELVMEDPSLLDQACSNLVYSLIHMGLELHTIDRVVGPSMGAITPAHDVARHISKLSMRKCFRSYTEKVETPEGTKMVFNRTRVKPGERVLLIEDVITTGGSVESVAEAVKEMGGFVAPVVLALVNRSGLTETKDKVILSLVDRQIENWKPEECPLCKEGSVAIHPKVGSNWELLNAKYY